MWYNKVYLRINLGRPILFLGIKMTSESIEGYLKTIYKLEQDVSPVTTSALAEQLRISSASVSEMAGKLAELGLVTREPYKGMALTVKGKHQALILIRRHRLWERFLTDILGLSWDQVHGEACRLEHVTSPLVEERLAQFLGEPETCPHGHPMPTAEGEIAVKAGRPLAEFTAGQRARVLRVPEGDDALLQYLATLGLKPQATIRVEAVAPFQGPLTVQVGEARHVLGRELASKIVVQPL
jgi:DtxR family Mn-dependent transcriptional regulator